ncbi:MAG: hypothetical protein ACQESR_09435 [Planctomycetota bacterium]
MERCPTQAVLPLVGLAAEKVIRDRYKECSFSALLFQENCLMKRGQQLLVCGVAALVVAVCGSVVEAQPGAGGRGGRPGGGFGMGVGGTQARLLAREDVRKELVLTDEQIEQLEGLREGVDMRSVFEGLQDVPREQRRERMQEAMQQAQKKVEKEVGEVLLKHQEKRLKELAVQYSMRGVGGILRGELAEELGISEQQGEQLREKAQELRQELEKKLQAELIQQLTPAQQGKLKELRGEPFTFEEGSNRQFGPRGDDGRNRQFRRAGDDQRGRRPGGQGAPRRQRRSR